jgi:AbiV family abortive infection protein
MALVWSGVLIGITKPRVLILPYPAADKLAANARRLFEDAKLLSEHGRYPSAAAIAILSMEEVGKYHVYRWKHQDPEWTTDRRFPPRHSDKQAAFAAPFVAMVQRRAMSEICNRIGAADWDKARGADDWEKTQDFLVEGYAVSQHAETEGTRQRAVDIL